MMTDEISFENWVVDMMHQENYATDKEVINAMHVDICGC